MYYHYYSTGFQKANTEGSLAVPFLVVCLSPVFMDSILLEKEDTTSCKLLLIGGFGIGYTIIVIIVVVMLLLL